MPYYNIGGTQRYFSDDSDGRLDAARAMSARALGEQMLGGGNSRALPPLLAAGHQVASLERGARQVEAAKGGGAYLPNDVQHALGQALRLLGKAGDGFSAPPVRGPTTATVAGNPNFSSESVTPEGFTEHDTARIQGAKEWGAMMFNNWGAGPGIQGTGITSASSPEGIDYNPTRPAKGNAENESEFDGSGPAKSILAEMNKAAVEMRAAWRELHAAYPDITSAGRYAASEDAHQERLEKAREAGRREARATMAGNGRASFSKGLDVAQALWVAGDLADADYYDFSKHTNLMAKATSSARESFKSDPEVRQLLHRIRTNPRLSENDKRALELRLSV